MSRERKDQRTWQEWGLQDLRDIPNDDWRILKEPSLVHPGETAEDAEKILSTCLGFSEGSSEIEFDTPVGAVLVQRSKLRHIVDKRRDARERYANFALATMRFPLEVWSVDYDDGSKRLVYIGVFSGSRHMLVVVSMVGGMLLWNFMHSDKKALNKHRHGDLIFQNAK